MWQQEWEKYVNKKAVSQDCHEYVFLTATIQKSYLEAKEKIKHNA